MSLDTLISSETLSDIADGVRHVMGTTKTYTPTEMAVELQGYTTSGIETGVEFLDHDGTILYSYTWDEIAELTELPDLPTWADAGSDYGFSIPMTCEGWNWTLDSLQEHSTGGKVLVGAVYCPTDTHTHYIMHIGAGTDACLGLTPSVDGGVSIDWGDGSDETVTEGTSMAYYEHTYDEEGYYEIIIKVTDGTVALGGDAVDGSTNRQAVGNLPSYSVDAEYLYHNGQLISAYCGSAVTQLIDYAFCQCFALTSATISTSVTAIGTYVFDGCTHLLSITIPDSVTSIDTCTFCNGYSLTSVAIPDSVTSIGSYAFYCCYSLTSVAIPDGVETIDAYSFYCCYSLRSIAIPDSVTAISNYAFTNCRALSDVSIPDGVESIGRNAFQNCRSLTSVVIPENCFTLGSYAFQYCYSLTSVTLLRDSTQYIYSYAFNGCVALVSIGSLYINSTATYTFRYCGRLTNVTATRINQSISFAESPLLTVDSLNNIIAALADYSTSSSSYTLTIGETNIAKLTDEELAVGTGKGWTIE